MTQGLAIGIDFGTTYLRVGVYLNEHLKVIFNEQNQRKTPCYVTLAGQQWIVGDMAKSRAMEDIENVVYSPKHLIGRTYNEVNRLKEKRLWPFDFVKDENGRAMLKLKGEPRPISPLEIVTRVFCKAKEISEAALKKEVVDVVITVPTRFTDLQKRDMVMAANQAQLKVLDIMEKTLAAATAYIFESKITEEQILVISMGGGSYDITVVELKHGKVIQSVHYGSAELGGQDFDKLLFEYYCKKLSAETTTKLNTQQKYSFLQECIKAKNTLSQSNYVEFSGKYLDEDIIFKIVRNIMKEIPEFQKHLEDIKSDILRAIDGSKSAIPKILLVGGPVYMKCISDCVDINLSVILLDDEAVVRGAAYHAGLIKSGEDPIVKQTDISCFVDSYTDTKNVESSQLPGTVISNNMPTDIWIEELYFQQSNYPGVNQIEMINSTTETTKKLDLNSLSYDCYF